MLLVVTARPAEPAGVAAELLDALRNEPATTVLRPGPLSVGATTALIRGALGDPVDAGLALACHEVAEGNPLLLGTASLVAGRRSGTDRRRGRRRPCPRRPRSSRRSCCRCCVSCRRRPSPSPVRWRRSGRAHRCGHVAALADLEPVAAAQAVDRLVAAGLVVPGTVRWPRTATALALCTRCSPRPSPRT